MSDATTIVGSQDPQGRIPRQMAVFATQGDLVICEDWGFKQHIPREMIAGGEALGPGDMVYVYADGTYNAAPQGE